MCIDIVFDCLESHVIGFPHVYVHGIIQFQCSNVWVAISSVNLPVYEML